MRVGTDAIAAAVRLSLLLATACSGFWLEEAAATPSGSPGTADFFVSGRGKDVWSGKLPDPRGDDGPFATVARAREAVRVLLDTQKESRPVRVVLRGGTYYLDSALEFGPEDSGTEQAPVVYAAPAGEKVVLSGGRRLENGRWGEVNGRKAWVVDVPEVKAGTWRFRQLFVNGERRPRTRLPKQGEYRIESLPGYTGDFLRSPTKQFVYAPGDIVPTWRNLPDVEIVGITRWLDNRLPIENVDGSTRIVTFDRASLFALVSSATSGDGTARPSVYWVENVFEALDSPGQWYLDRPQGRLYYLPRPNEQMASAEIIAPRLTQVVRVVGRAGAPVHDLRFEGLVFAHTQWQPSADYASSLQAGIEVPGALLFDYAERCAVTGGAIEHIGNYAVEVGVGCADIEIARNRITDIGAGGIRIGHFFSWETDGSGRLTERGLRRKAAMPQGPHSRRITVADNEIGHCGRFTLEAVGVFVGDNADNKVIHNHIHDVFYSGISVGSVQDFGPSEARGNIIEYNHIHDIGQGMLSDLAGIYACSTPDSRIAYNVVHDVVRREYGGWGIYPDEGSHDLLIEKNLVYRCQDGALFAHHNRDITAQDNIFAFSRGAQIERGGIGGFELTCRRNLIHYLEGQAIGNYGGRWGRDVCVFERNLYWNVAGKPVLFANQSFAEWQATGQDTDSLIADPLFVDPAHGDFTLRPGSPAAQIGFEPWDMLAAGPRSFSTTRVTAAPAEQNPAVPVPAPELSREHLADYDAELRRPDGRVDVDAMIARLKELGVTTYYWLIWHAPTDWDDLKLFLPKAAAARIDVWVYLVPPSESPPRYGSQYSEPFRLDYHRWAEEIARLSLQQANLTAWVIDDFYANHEFFTPAYLREMQARARRINPRLAFLPLMYFDEIRAKFAEEYREVIDGVVVAYLRDRDEIEWTWAILNDAAVVPPSELSYPWDTPSKAGDFAVAAQSAQVLPADRYTLAFRERDDFTGPTVGYHFKQLLVDGAVVWEQDVAGGSAGWRKVTVDVTEHVRGKAGVVIAFRLFDKQGVSNFGVRWHLSELRGENLRVGAGLAEPGKWKVDRQGLFEAGFGSAARSGERRFHIPFISMTAGDVHEFQQRHGDPATPERVAEWLRMSLQARRDGKCDGVVTYCLDKRPESRTFPLARQLFREFRRHADPPNASQSWWLAKDLRVVSYEFLERGHRSNDLTVDEILESVDRLGGCDLMLLKGFHYWQGRFDDSSWGYPRFRSLAARLIPKLHARGIRAGIFGFTDRRRSYGNGPDHRRIMEVWKEYVDLGADILFVDEESGGGGLDIPASCLSHCDELRTALKLPVGLFLYGPASQAGQVRAIGRHVDVIGEMGYNLFLDARGDYGLEEITRQWSQALKGATDRPVAYWTGALVMLESRRRPGSPFWRERFGERTLGRYFEDYLQRARDSGADGLFFHSLCRLSGLPVETQAEVAAAMKRVFELRDGRPQGRMSPLGPGIVSRTPKVRSLP